MWLTSDGSATGRACLVSVVGADLVLSAVVGNTQISNSGLPSNESPFAPNGGGRPLEFEIPKLATNVYNSLKTILDAAAVAGSEINVTGTGEPGNFNCDCIVLLNPNYLTFGLFSTGNVKKVIIRLITTRKN